jgi:hypothetical protein
VPVASSNALHSSAVSRLTALRSTILYIGRASVPSRQRQLIFVGVVKPWVSPPAGSAAVKLQALEGHDERVQKWLPVRRRAGIKEKAHYLHDLIAHGSQVVEFFKANLPGRCPQEFNCEMQEACNKLCKLELPRLRSTATLVDARKNAWRA